MSEIYESNPSFRLVKKYVRFAIKRYYSEFIVIGKENIPANVPVIFAPNHNNALMDALAVHAAAPAEMPIVFLARADLFKNQTAAKFLYFCKIMPAFRMRDGVENLEKNNGIFERCVEVLDKNQPLGIMPEGNQGDKLKIRPLVKGIFRIAFAAQKKHGTEPCVKIIPVGIDYGDYVKSHKHIIVSFGKPIEVADYMSEFDHNPVKTTNAIRNKLKNDLSNITLNLSTEKFYDCFRTATEVSNSTFQDKLKMPRSTVSLFLARQKIAQKLFDLEKHNPAVIRKLDRICEEYRSLLSKMNFENSFLERAPFKLTSLLLEGFFLINTSIIFVLGFILNFLPYFCPAFFRKYVFKTEYPGFISSLHFGLGLVSFPLFYLMQTVLFYLITGFSWWIVLLFIFSQYYLGKFSLLWYRETGNYFVKLRLCRLNKSTTMSQAQKLRLKIIQIVNS